MSAAMTILSAWTADGSPRQGLLPWGSFEAWDMIRDVLVWVGLPDPIESRRDLQDAGDRDKGSLSGLFAALDLAFPGGSGFSASKIADKVRSFPELMEALEELGVIERGAVNTRLLAWRIKHAKGRVVDGRFLDVCPVQGGRSLLWRIRDAKK
jgi:hypothetical protein